MQQGPNGVSRAPKLAHVRAWPMPWWRVCQHVLECDMTPGGKSEAVDDDGLFVATAAPRPYHRRFCWKTLPCDDEEALLCLERRLAYMKTRGTNTMIFSLQRSPATLRIQMIFESNDACGEKYCREGAHQEYPRRSSCRTCAASATNLKQSKTMWCPRAGAKRRVKNKAKSHAFPWVC